MPHTSEILARILGQHARKREERMFRYGVSNAGDCARKNVYAAREPSACTSEAPPRWNLAMELGTAVGDWLERKARAWEQLQTQVPVVVCEKPRITGTADVVGSDFVADFKFVGTSQWRAIQKRPDPKHWEQVHTYAASLGKPRAALWYIRNNPSGEEIDYLVWEEPTDHAHRGNVVAAWQIVDRHLAAGTLPPRAHPWLDSIECKTCRHRAACEGEP